MGFKVKLLTAAAALALSGGALSLAAGPAIAASGVPVVSNTAGESGYFGNDDGHTHYRYTQTEVTVSPTLKNLNGTGDNEGAVGTELCDPNTGIAAQVGLYWNGSAYKVVYASGHLMSSSPTPSTDPCIQDGFITGLSSADTLLSSFTINQGDVLQLAVYYTPGGKHEHQISFGVCDETQNVCRQAYSESRYQLNFWEFGTGAVTNNTQLTAGAINQLETFSSDYVTCYSCKSQTPIGSVKAVNGSGTGGITEANFVNSSSQVVMSPNGSLTVPGGSSFTLSEGSTSS